MEVNVISVETIKPYSTTPPHLRTFNTSLTDSFLARSYIPFIIYYTVKDKSDDYNFLKRSLAETLTRFYPLAGRVNEKNNIIHCNDEGVLFSTARVNCRLSDVLKNPKIEELYKFMFIQPKGSVQAEISIQLNEFECGSVAISVLFSHFICDGKSMSTFMTCWSEISLGKMDGAHPCFPASELFPRGEDPIPLPSAYFKDRLLNKEGHGVMRRFVFEKRGIQALQERAKSELVSNPTRVEAVSMFIWKHCMLASEKLTGVPKASLLTLIADLRKRLVPPLPEYSVGNIFWKVLMLNRVDDSVDLDQLVISFKRSVNESMEKIVSKIQKNEGRSAVLENVEALGEICRDTNLNPFYLSSWCRMGFTDIDFGWGKPLWFSLGLQSENIPPQRNGTILLLGGVDGGNRIELWLTLDHREMILLEGDIEFLTFATLNPPILV